MKWRRARSPSRTGSRAAGPWRKSWASPWLERPEALEVLAGQRVPNGTQPFATVYSGHQFGVWAGQLGDGRAMEGDFGETERLLKVLEHPFDEQPEHEADAGFPPDWASQLEVSCSS